jgi:hypothetical protein
MAQSLSLDGQCRRLRLPNAWPTQKLLVWLWQDYWQVLETHTSEAVRRRRRAITRARRRMAMAAAMRSRAWAIDPGPELAVPPQAMTRHGSGRPR